MRNMLSQVNRLVGNLCLRFCFSVFLGAMKAIHHGHEERIKVYMGLPFILRDLYMHDSRFLERRGEAVNAYAVSNVQCCQRTNQIA